MKITRLQGHKFIVVVVILSLFAVSPVAHAKVSKQFKQAFEAQFTPAIYHRGLETAAETLEMDKLRTFVVVEKGGLIPADRAYYFISPSEYDYRV